MDSVAVWFGDLRCITVMLCCFSYTWRPVFCSSGVDATAEHLYHINLDPGHYSRKHAFSPENFYFLVSNFTLWPNKALLCISVQICYLDLLLLFVLLREDIIKADRHNDKKSGWHVKMSDTEPAKLLTTWAGPGAARTSQLWCHTWGKKGVGYIVVHLV